MNEVLDMGKLESGEVVLENVPFDLPELMHEITDVLENRRQNAESFCTGNTADCRIHGWWAARCTLSGC